MSVRSIKGFYLCSTILISIIVGVSLVPFPSFALVSAQPNVQYTLGNWTYVNKLGLPVKISESQIQVGLNWTYIYTLEAGLAYRVYCYGDWIDYSSETNKTDYDIFVYNPSGNLESYHTEAAGLPEHLGTTVYHPFFIPKQSGNYSFLIINDARESSGAEAATFMLIEHIDSGKWYQHYMEGKVKDEPVETTSRVYEFNTTSKRIEVLVEVPDTLDMYEVRLYIMTNPSETEDNFLNGVPLAWEEGLYGNNSEIYGGYNLNSDGFRYNERIDSCEYPGEDMLINFTAPVEGNLLYHIVLIAENGAGNIKFMVKTDFNAPELSIIDQTEKVKPDKEIHINAHIEEQFNLETVTLNYTVDEWATSTAIEMIGTQNKTYTATIHGQAAGTTVNYTVLGRDTSGNSAEVLGSYAVKNSANMTLELSSSVVYYDGNITVTGSIPVSGTNVTVTYFWLNNSALNNTALDYVTANNTILNHTSNDAVISRVVSTDSSGIFDDVYPLKRTGKWIVFAIWNGSETFFGTTSDYKKFTVNKINMSITCNIMSESITIGDNITTTGLVYPILENLTVTLIFTTANDTVEQKAYTNSNGTFSLSWKPDLKGLWRAYANIAENASISAAFSNVTSFTVNDTFLNQYMLYIIGGVSGAAGISVVGFIIRRRRYE